MNESELRVKEWIFMLKLPLRLPMAQKLAGCRGPDFGYFRYRG